VEEVLPEAAVEEVVVVVAEISVVVAEVDGTAEGAEVARLDVEVPEEVAFRQVVAEEVSAEEGGAVNKLSNTIPYIINFNIQAQRHFPSLDYDGSKRSLIGLLSDAICDSCRHDVNEWHNFYYTVAEESSPRVTDMWKV